ncbi:MAG TPA: leucine-rich repeat domain-containing protein [Flavobacteriales bacterium]|nr:leucine-rich repeat domain-containing protein [Flavobacteriales bacterium]
MNKLFFLLFVFLVPTLTKGQDSTGSKIYRNLDMALRNPDEVEILDLSKQHLKEFPVEIFKFTNLRELYMSKNRLSAIPAEIGTLTKLEIVDFSRNKLESLPHEITKCVKLRKLIANNNIISELPSKMNLLQELEYLDLWSNDLGAFPESIRFCKKLKEVDMRVIELTKTEQETMQKLLPNTTIYFSPHCNCSH